MKYKILNLFIMSLGVISSSLSAAVIYVTNEAPKKSGAQDTIVHVQFLTSSNDTTLIQFDVAPGETGSYTDLAVNFNRVKFNVTGPDAAQIKIFGLTGERYTRGKNGFYQNAFTGEYIMIPKIGIWRFWAKK